MEKRAMTIIFRACVVAIGLIFTTIPSNAQVLLNQGFEIEGGLYTNTADTSMVTTGALNWSQFNNALRTLSPQGGTNTARNGSYSLKCYGDTTWIAEGAYQVISNGVNPGATYVLSGYGLILSSDALTNSNPLNPQPFGQIQMHFRDSSGVEISGAGGSAPNFTSARGLDAWQSSVLTAQAPATASQIILHVMELGYGAAAVGSIYFDDISVVDLNAPIVTNLYIMTISKGNQVCWPTQTNAAYQAQSSPNNVTWTDVATPLPGDGNTNCTFESGSFGQRFYRVLELQ